MPSYTIHSKFNNYSYDDIASYYAWKYNCIPNGEKEKAEKLYEKFSSFLRAYPLTKSTNCECSKPNFQCGSLALHIILYDNDLQGDNKLINIFKLSNCRSANQEEWAANESRIGDSIDDKKLQSVVKSLAK